MYYSCGNFNVFDILSFVFCFFIVILSTLFQRFVIISSIFSSIILSINCQFFCILHLILFNSTAGDISLQHWHNQFHMFPLTLSSACNSSLNNKTKKSTVNLSSAYHNWKTWILNNTLFCSFNLSLISLVVLPVNNRIFTSIFD